jgi:hypothetical protein
MRAVVEAARAWRARHLMARGAERLQLLDAVTDAVDAYEEAKNAFMAASEPERCADRLAATGGGVHLVCPVCGFDNFPEGGMHAAYSIHMLDHERKGEGGE